MNPDPNVRCFYLILKNDKPALAEHLARGFDFESFKIFCEKNLISGYVYSAASANKASSLFPAEFIDRAKVHYLNQWAINERLIQGMENILDFFSREKIEVIFLKGPFLAERFYGQAACRVTRDIDILVKHEDIHRADRALQVQGFTRRSDLLLNRESTVRFTHHFEYAKPGMKAELHWVLARHFSFRTDYERLWADRKVFGFRGKDYRVLSDEQELVMQILSIFTDIPLGTLVLKQFADVYHIVKKLNFNEAEWDRFFEDRKKENLLRISVNILDLVLGTLGASADFPELSKTLKRYESLIRLKNHAAQNEILANPKNLKTRLWSFGLYETSLIQSFGWWAVSLPFRLSAYSGWAARFSKSRKRAAV